MTFQKLNKVEFYMKSRSHRAVTNQSTKDQSPIAKKKDYNDVTYAVEKLLPKIFSLKYHRFLER